MAKGSHLIIETPRGKLQQIKIGSGALKGTVYARLTWNPRFKPNKERSFSNAQEFVDSECLRYMNSLTPRRTGFMIKSATLGTVVGSGNIQYLAPYARRQYYEHKKKSKWFETMKAQRKETIMKGANKIASQ